LFRDEQQGLDCFLPKGVMVLHTQSDPIQTKIGHTNSQYINNKTKRITKATHGPPARKKQSNNGEMWKKKKKIH
jgi:hypothetical protein